MISLAEAVKLKSILNVKYKELFQERRRVAFVTVEKGETAVVKGRSIAQVEAELDTIRKDIRTLDRLVYEANLNNTINFLGEQLTLVEAIEYAKQIRYETEEIKDLSYSEKEELQMGYGDLAIVRVAMFDPESYRLKADEYERLAHKLSNLINAKNYQIQINFDDSKYI